MPVAVAALLAACTHVVTPPSPGPDAAGVFLLDHGRTSSLVLPRDAGLARYSYGDWDWYALNRKGPLRGSGILLGPTDAGIGRGELPPRGTAAGVARAVRVPVERAWRIEVPAGRAAALGGSLEALFARDGVERVANPLYGQTFVPHPQPYYSLGHNSNHVTAGWLRRLGCRVRMRGIWSSWVVERPGAP